MASSGVARIYEDIAKQIEPEYKRRGVHKRYKRVTRKIKDEFGNITGEVVNDESMGLYDKDGRRLVNYANRAKNMKFCSSFLKFEKIEYRKKLIEANFCRVPLCPMCQWRKSMRIFFEVSKIMQIVGERYLGYVPVFLTLTIRNCSVDDLSKNLDNIFKAWDIFMHSNALIPEIKGKRTHIIKGWFRALEVTYNDKTNEFHPHFHAIMLVDKNYFKSKDYKSTAEWVQLWRRAAKLDYDPVCDIRRTRSDKGQRKEVAEVAKYTYKDAEILNNKLSDDKKSDVVKSLSSALHGRRLYAYGGVMKEIAAELKFKDIDKADLIKTGEDDGINDSLAKMILTYHWDIGVSNYTLAKKSEFAEKEKGKNKLKVGEQ